MWPFGLEGKAEKGDIRSKEDILAHKKALTEMLYALNELLVKIDVVFPGTKRNFNAGKFEL